MLAFVYKTLAFPDVTSQPLCPLTVTVNRSQHIKNECVCIQNNNILKTPALSDVASWPLCPLTVTVNKCQHLQNTIIHIKNISISRCYKSTAMPLNSNSRQVVPFKEHKRSYTKHQHFRWLQVDHYYPWPSQSTGASIQKMPVFIYKTPAFSDVTSHPLCPLTVMVDSILNRPAFLNVAMSIHSHGRQVTAFPNVTSRQLWSLDGHG